MIIPKNITKRYLPYQSQQTSSIIQAPSSARTNNLEVISQSMYSINSHQSSSYASKIHHQFIDKFIPFKQSKYLEQNYADKINQSKVKSFNNNNGTNHPLLKTKLGTFLSSKNILPSKSRSKLNNHSHKLSLNNPSTTGFIYHLSPNHKKSLNKLYAKKLNKNITIDNLHYQQKQKQKKIQDKKEIKNPQTSYQSISCYEKLNNKSQLILNKQIKNNSQLLSQHESKNESQTRSKISSKLSNHSNDQQYSQNSNIYTQYQNEFYPYYSNSNESKEYMIRTQDNSSRASRILNQDNFNSSLLNLRSIQTMKSRIINQQQQYDRNLTDKSIYQLNQGLYQVNSMDFQKNKMKKQKGRTVSNYQVFPAYSYNQSKRLSQMEERVVQLKQRLKNLHYFYDLRIKEIKQKNKQKSQFLMSVLDDLQQFQQIKKYKFTQELKNKKINNDEGFSLKQMTLKIMQFQRDVGEVNENLQIMKQKNQQLKDHKKQNEIRMKLKKEILEKMKKDLHKLQVKTQLNQSLKQSLMNNDIRYQD